MKDILDGIATYTSPDLKMFDELFTASEMQYYILPFSEENYTKYVEMMYKYSNTFSTFTKEFRDGLLKLVNAIYPIGNINTEPSTYVKPNRNALKIFKRPKLPEIKSETEGFEKVVEE